MGKCIPTHGSFFRFILALRYQEWLKAKQVRSSAESGGSTGPIRKGKSKVGHFHFYVHLKMKLISSCLSEIDQKRSN